MFISARGGGGGRGADIQLCMTMFMILGLLPSEKKTYGSVL